MNNNQAIYFFHQGTNFYSYRFLGAHYQEETTVFRLWAPHAKAISVIGDFNNWHNGSHPMHKISNEGIWEVEIKGVKEFDCYQYAIKTPSGKWINKSDPFAFHSEVRPKTASKVFNLNSYQFNDDEWVKNRIKNQSANRPLNIYELNLGSWRRYSDGSFFDYQKLGEEISSYAKEMGYTHVEIMPVSEYPLDESWGYQITGYYSITSRFGTPSDFKAFVDICHQKGIGVIVDWVPGHFCKDAHGLIEFDGKPLYEPSHPLRQEHKSWGTRCFDYGRTEIQSFLISNALYFLEEFHVDGLRVDAVASMLYLDYDRDEWLPNSYGTNINLDAVAFIKKLNDTVHQLVPGILMIAEESTTFPLITKPTNDEGLGFDYKWNMGWMNDTLGYMKTDPLFRSYHHHQITFQMTYIYSELFILALSHDEVVHGKHSLINKMPGNYEQKFAGYMAYLAYMMSHPGKKLTFMGSELGQFIEWNEKQELDWLLLQYESHQLLQKMVKDVNHLYLKYPALHQNDTNWDGFKWVNADDVNRNVYSYYRIDKRKNKILVICNFSFVNWNEYVLNIEEGTYMVVFSTTDYQLIPKSISRRYQTNLGKLTIDLPPICVIYLRKVKK